MSLTAPQQLIISGIISDNSNFLASSGDVRLHPGSNRTGYIDGYIFDGQIWRSLDLRSFGSISRAIGVSRQAGPVMREIASQVIRCKGMAVYYELVPPAKKRRYVFRAPSASTFLAPRY